MHSNEAIGNSFLVAYIKNRGNTTVEELRTYLTSKLPLALIPSRFVFLSTFPLLINGKTDYKALQKYGNANNLKKSTSPSHHTFFQKALVQIWEELLQTKNIGIDNNIFDLGAHSLLIIQACQKLNDRIGTQVPLLAFFKHPTIRALSERSEVKKSCPEKSSRKTKAALMRHYLKEKKLHH